LPFSFRGSARSVASMAGQRSFSKSVEGGIVPVVVRPPASAPKAGTPEMSLLT
jgi:hypothetical protein